MCGCASAPVSRGLTLLLLSLEPHTVQSKQGVRRSHLTTRIEAVDESGKQGLMIPVYLHV